MFEIGTIVNTQGIKGEVRVLSSTFDERRFELLNEIEVVKNGAARSMRIEYVRYQRQFVILKLIGIEDMTAAEQLKTAVIRIPDDKALPLGEDEYYLRDLYGLTVVTEDGEVLGELVRVIETGANDVYVVRNADGGQGTGELLIPAIRQCIVNVDLASQRMTVRLLEGLR